MVEKTAHGQICKWKVGYTCNYKGSIFVVLQEQKYNYRSSDRAKSKQLKECR